MYESHLRLYLLPHLDRTPLASLTTGEVRAMFLAIGRQHHALGAPLSATTLHSIRCTLRAALNAAIPFRTFFRVGFYLPVVTSIAVVSLAFTFFFSPLGGAFNPNRTAVENLLLLGSSTGEGYFSTPGHVRAYDVVTGRLALL